MHIYVHINTVVLYILHIDSICLLPGGAEVMDKMVKDYNQSEKSNRPNDLTLIVFFNVNCLLKMFTLWRTFINLFNKNDANCWLKYLAGFFHL